MKIHSIHKKTKRTRKDAARIKALREKYQSERATVEQLLASGDYSEPMPLGAYLKIKALMHRLKESREQAGLSLADMADRTGMDRAALSRLENGRQPNPTLATVTRYALALGKQIGWTVSDLRPARKS